jgi:type IV pilus assembly protein PilA
MSDDKAQPVDIDWSRYETFVGPKWEYYRPRFERFARGRTLSWNWAACFGTLAWLRYRKLRAWSWMYLPVSAPVLFLFFMLFVAFGPDECEKALSQNLTRPFQLIALAWAALIWIALPALANRVYYARVRDSVEKAGLESRAARGGAVFALTLQAIFVLAVLVMSSQYSSYVYRSRVSEAFSLADGLKTSVGEYFQTHGRFPAQTSEVSGPVAGEYVSALVVGPGGTIRATYNEKAQKLVGHSVVMVPVADTGGLRWSCSSPDLPDVCLPIHCRADERR